MIEVLLQAERALSVGLLDRAETLYRQVSEADPRNSIAVVGLARVALERGNERESLMLGRRALEIDPENDAAKRLVQRLEEVLAYRDRAAVAPAVGVPSTPASDASPRVDAAPPEFEPGLDIASPSELTPAPDVPPPPDLAPEHEAARAAEVIPAPEDARGDMPATEPRRSRWRSWFDRLFRRR